MAGRGRVQLSQMHPESERRLIDAARTNPVAFGELYERHVEAIYSYAWRRLGDQLAAEDITAETFKRALENIHRYEWRGVPFSAWLYRIASNQIAARYRSPLLLDPTDPANLDVPDTSALPEHALLEQEQRDELMNALRLLPSDQQQVVVLRFGQELSAKEIAVIMERNEGAVKALLHRAVAGLGRRLRGGAEIERMGAER